MGLPTPVGPALVKPDMMEPGGPLEFSPAPAWRREEGDPHYHTSQGGTKWPPGDLLWASSLSSETINCSPAPRPRSQTCPLAPALAARAAVKVCKHGNRSGFLRILQDPLKQLFFFHSLSPRRAKPRATQQHTEDAASTVFPQSSRVELGSGLISS